MSQNVQDRLPPNQALAAHGKWPVVGERAPRDDASAWTVTIDGLVAKPHTWTLDELLARPQQEFELDIHCVTRWSKLDASFSGLPLAPLLEACKPLPEGRFLSFIARSDHGHSTSLPLTDALQLGTFLAFRHEQEPLSEIHGGPVRTIVPGRYFYKSLKWLERIEVLAQDRLGTWEAESGYHNHADPWREERYIVSNLDRRQVKRLLDAKNLEGRELLGLQAERMPLDDLDARGALLRDAGFVETSLRRSRFDGANLSNAHFQGADLSGASLRDADLEGADFRGADLTSVDLAGASLFGATFCPEPSSSEPSSPEPSRPEPGSPEPSSPETWGAACVDGLRGLSREQVSRVSEAQQAFLSPHVKD